MLPPSVVAMVDPDRVLHAVSSTRLLDQADRTCDRRRRVVLEPERECEVEEELGVGRPFDLGW